MDEKIRAILATALKLPVEHIDETSAIGTVPGWDSTAHMRIVFALEDEFGVDLDEKRIVEMTSFTKIRDTIRELQSR